jgi:NAD(P)-dependent dehydrogenase (short-subunit alcohol dehydrogenase family)
MRRGEEQTMSGSTPLQGRHALVTGASSGLGADLARELACRGAGLLPVARREDRLRALERELVDRHGVTVDVAVLDLTADGAPEELRRRTNAGRSTCWPTTPATASTAGSSSWTGSASATCWSWT